MKFFKKKCNYLMLKFLYCISISIIKLKSMDYIFGKFIKTILYTFIINKITLINIRARKIL